VVNFSFYSFLFFSFPFLGFVFLVLFFRDKCFYIQVWGYATGHT
jgi:hypothetical protein